MEKNVNINIISQSGYLPSYETKGASGMDLRAYLKEPVTLKPLERKLIPTGIFIELPEGYEAQIRARSGMAIKYGIGLVNGIGTIDSDYRGELLIPVINFGNEIYTINNGDRIAQMVICKFVRADLKIIDNIVETERGKGGFGHTGFK